MQRREIFIMSSSYCFFDLRGMITDFSLKQLDVHYGVAVDPDERDKAVDDWDIRACSAIIKRHLPDVDDKPAIVERCIYTVQSSLSHY